MVYHADVNGFLVVAYNFGWEKCRSVRGLLHDGDDDMTSGETVTGTGVQRMGKMRRRAFVANQNTPPL